MTEHTDTPNAGPAPQESAPHVPSVPASPRQPRPNTLPSDVLKQVQGGKSRGAVVSRDELDDAPVAATHTFQVQLPSQGLLYPNGEATILMRLPSAEEESILYAPGDTLLNFSQFLNACIVDCGSLDPGDLLVTDGFYLLLALRIQLYGPLYKFNWRCQYCNAPQRDQTNLIDDLSLREVDDEAGYEPFLLEIEPPSGKVTVGCRLLRRKDEMRIAQEVKKRRMRSDGFGSDNSDPTRLITLSHYIAEIDGQPVTPQKAEKHLKRWTMRETNKLDRLIEKVQTGIDTGLVRTCRACSTDNDIDLPMGPDFLRPRD